MPHGERCAHMRAVAWAIGERHVELAAVVSLETGKTRVESIAEVQEAIDLIETYCTTIEAAGGFTSALQSFTPNERNLETLRPYGVFGVIVPFNFPIALAVNMLSAAVIAGNTVVVKPSEKTPRTGSLLGEILSGANLPPGTVQPCPRRPRDRSCACWRRRRRDRVHRFGAGRARDRSSAVARSLDAPSAGRDGREEPGDRHSQRRLAQGSRRRRRAAFGLSGQKCSACSRAIVVDDVHDEFVERLCAFTQTLSVGDPSDRASALGPVIDERAVSRFEESVALARRDGTVAVGGRRLELGGHFVEPTVVCDLPVGHSLTRDELFLPFVSVTRSRSLEGAIAEANAVDYGLTAGIFSEDDAEVREFLDAHRGRGALCEPSRRSHDGSMAGIAIVLRMEGEWPDGQGWPRPVLSPTVHARAEPHDRGMTVGRRGRRQ